MAEQERQPRSTDELQMGIDYFNDQIREIAKEGLNPDGSSNPFLIIPIIEDAWPPIIARRALLFALGEIPLEEVVPAGVIKITTEEQALGLPEFPLGEKQTNG